MKIIDYSNYEQLLEQKVISIYTSNVSLPLDNLLIRFDEEMMYMSMSDGGFNIQTYNYDEWERYFDGVNLEKYYPYNCFEGKIIKDIRVAKEGYGDTYIEISFYNEDKRLKVSVEFGKCQLLDTDIIRDAYTVDFSNKSIGQVDAVINGFFDDNVRYSDISVASRKIYYYYSCVDNVFELAGYIYDVMSDGYDIPIADKHDAYLLARRLIE